MTTVWAATCLSKAVNIHRQTNTNRQSLGEASSTACSKRAVKDEITDHVVTGPPLQLSCPEDSDQLCRTRGAIVLGYAAATHKKHRWRSSTRHPGSQQGSATGSLYLTSLYIIPLKGIMRNFLIQWSSSPNSKFDVVIKPNRECSCVKVFITLITWPCRDLWGKRTDNVVEKRLRFHLLIIKTARLHVSV